MSLFDWFKKKPTIESSNVIKGLARMPVSKDWTDQYTVNSELTRGLYHNTYPGMKLAGGLAYPPIAIPVNFMGLPVPKPVDDNDETTKAELAGQSSNIGFTKVIVIAPDGTVRKIYSINGGLPYPDDNGGPGFEHTTAYNKAHGLTVTVGGLPVPVTWQVKGNTLYTTDTIEGTPNGPVINGISSSKGGNNDTNGRINGESKGRT